MTFIVANPKTTLTSYLEAKEEILELKETVCELRDCIAEQAEYIQEIGEEYQRNLQSIQQGYEQDSGMHSVRVEQVEDICDSSLRWNIYYGSLLIASFTQESSANKFILSDLCKILIEHCDAEEI